MRFKKYIKRYKNNDSIEGYFVKDVFSDREFPKQIIISAEKYHGKIYKYLLDVGACRAALEAFENIWKDYISLF